MNILSTLSVAIRLTGPILLVAMGGIMAMKVNIFNLGLEGFMLVSCFASICGAHFLNSVWGGILFGVMAGVTFVMIYAIFIFELKADSIICAIAVILVASGLTRFLVKPIFGTSGRFQLPQSLAMPTLNAGWLGSIPIIGPILNGQSILTLFALFCPLILYFLLYKTNLGLNIRAVGLNEEAAVSAGIHTKRVKYFALFLNGILCGLGGAQLALSVYMFNADMTDGRGFIALSSGVLAGGNPILTGLAALLFGFAETIEMALAKYGISPYLLKMLPYALAAIAAVLPYASRKVTNKIRRSNSEKSMISEYYKKL